MWYDQIAKESQESLKNEKVTWTLGLTLIAKKSRHLHVGLQVWQLITTSQFDDWRHIVHHWKGNFRSFKTIFPQDQKSRNRNFSIVHLSSQHSVTSPTLGPSTTIKREIYYIRHTASKRPKESDLFAFSRKMHRKNHGKLRHAMLFTSPNFPRAFSNYNVPWQRKWAHPENNEFRINLQDLHFLISWNVYKCIYN